MTKPLRDRFWPKVQINGPNECWPWMAFRLPKGYGTISLGSAKSGKAYAHRVAFFLTHGRWPNIGRHSCDNPPCCNPAHILDGSRSDNARDSVSRGRWGYRGMPGNAHARKKPGEGKRAYIRKAR